MLKKDRKATNQSYHLLLPVGAKYQCTKTNIIKTHEIQENNHQCQKKSQTRANCSRKVREIESGSWER